MNLIVIRYGDSYQYENYRFSGILSYTPYIIFVGLHR
jgi:hypothetical protein